MKKTLQDQYLLIKEGKGHKGVFLTEAKREFPHIVRTAATFDEAVASLKTKNIISENVISVMPAIMDRPKKESYETAFEAFLAEAKKKNEDEKVKAEEKKVSKPVEEDLEKNFDYSDEKNPDNMIFDQIMMGYYAEMKDPKNADKTMQQLKDIVFKNLAKDPIYYTKDGQFGVKGLGYTTEAPGLGEPKPAKGKYASSGYGNLNENREIEESYPGNPLNPLEKELKNKRINAEIKGINYDFINVYDENGKQTHEITLKNGEYVIRDASGKIVKTSNNTGDIINFVTLIKKSSSPVEYRPFHRYPDSDLEETKLRKVIREMIDAELEEAGRGFATMGTINIKGDGDGKLFIPKYYILPPVARKKLNLLNPGENAPAYNESIKIPHIKVLPDNTILYSNYLVNALDNPSDIKNPLNSILKDLESNFYWSQFKTYTKKFISSTAVKYPVLGREAVYNVLEFPNDFEVLKLKDWVESELKKQYAKLEKAESGVTGRGRPVNIESLKKFIANLESLNQNPEGGMVVVLPQMFEESLRESVEKDLADINKEAEHEVLQAKLDKIDVLIDKRKAQLSKLDEDEDMKALTDKKKVKELEKDIKKLEVVRNKVEKMMSKFKSKKSSNKEIIDEDEPMEEAQSDPKDVENMNKTLEKVKKNMTDMSKIELFEKDIDSDYIY